MTLLCDERGNRDKQIFPKLHNYLGLKTFIPDFFQDFFSVIPLPNI